MEMCIDNPREGFSNVFDTHPSVEKRVEALVKFAGGHDPGPLTLASHQPFGSEPAQVEAQTGGSDGGPWGPAPCTQAPGPWGEPPQPNAPVPGGAGPWGPKP
jgi:heat shock protein HtpX